MREQRHFVRNRLVQYFIDDQRNRYGIVIIIEKVGIVAHFNVLVVHFVMLEFIVQRFHEDRKPLPCHIG
ncbi:hypothetical protein D3C84_1286640 [compost metagenome]